MPKTSPPEELRESADGSYPLFAAAEPRPRYVELTAWEQVLRTLDAEAERPPEGSVGFAEFELDFERALMRQLGPFFESLPALQLSPDHIRSVVSERARGAYYLLLDGRIVYIGKSDAKAGLQARLLRHFKTLKRRRGIEWAEMKFKAVKVASLAALDTESLLLRLYEMRGAAGGTERRPEWNFSGFGSNDPGVRRDTQRVSLFDQQFPLNLDAVIDFESDPPGSALSLENYVRWLRRELKFTFRLQTKSVPLHLSLAAVTVNAAGMTASPRLEDLLLRIHEKLPPQWVLTVLRGKVVLYLNDRRDYKSPLWRLVSGQAPGLPDYLLRDVGRGGALDEAIIDDEEQDSESGD